MVTVLFDSKLRTRSGKRIPYWDESYMETAVDNELTWFHEGYGLMKLYRLLKVDEKNFIAEDLHVCCRTCDERWAKFSETPELALT